MKHFYGIALEVAESVDTMIRDRFDSRFYVHDCYLAGALNSVMPQIEANREVLMNELATLYVDLSEGPDPREADDVCRDVVSGLAKLILANKPVQRGRLRRALANS